MKKIKLIPLFTLFISCGIGNKKDVIEGLWTKGESKYILEINKIEDDLYVLNARGENGFGIKKGDTIYCTSLRENDPVLKIFLDKKGDLIAISEEYIRDTLQKINTERAEQIINLKLNKNR